MLFSIYLFLIYLATHFCRLPLCPYSSLLRFPPNVSLNLHPTGPMLRHSVGEDSVEDQPPDQSHSADPKAEVQATPGHVDQEQQQQQGFDVDHERNTSLHQKQQVRSLS